MKTIPVLAQTLLAAGLAVALAACSSKAKTVPRQGAGAASAQVKASPVAASALREHAVLVVEEMSVNQDPNIRAAAAEAASFVPSRLKPIVAKGLEDPNSGVRGVTAMAIGRARLKGYDDRLVRLLNDPQTITQVSATFALVRTGANVDRSPLASWLLNDPNPWVKRQAADVLGMIGDKSALPLIKAAARERFPSVPAEQNRILQLLLAEAMIRLGDESQRPVIRAALYPASPDELEVSALAASIIGEIEDRDAVAQLIYLTQYRDKAGQQYPAEVRLAAAASLAKLGQPQGSFIADEYVKNPNAVIRAQAALVYSVTRGPENSDKLEMLMNDPEPLVRVSAASAVLRASVK